jgi:hypothetical protein
LIQSLRHAGSHAVLFKNLHQITMITFWTQKWP